MLGGENNMIATVTTNVKGLIALIPDVLTELMSSPYALFVAMAVMAALIKQAKKLAPAKR